MATYFEELEVKRTWKMKDGEIMYSTYNPRVKYLKQDEIVLKDGKNYKINYFKQIDNPIMAVYEFSLMEKD